MTVTDQSEADELFKELVEEVVAQHGKPRGAAEQIVRDRLGYLAGYYGNVIRERVERFFRCEHPVFGRIAIHGPPSQEEAFQAGLRAARDGLSAARTVFVRKR